MNDEFWKEKALNQPIEKVIFRPDLLKLTRQIAIEGESFDDWQLPEQSGYLSGLVYGKTFYILSNNGLSRSSGANVEIEKPDFTSNFIDVKLFENFSNFRTVLYHSHPEVNENQLKKLLNNDDLHYIDSVKMANDSGLYEDIEDNGRGKLVSLLTDIFTRDLSESDVELTPGRYSLLISSTNHSVNQHSQLNFYDISTDEHKLVECDIMKYNNIKNNVKDFRKWKEVRSNAHKELWGFSTIDDDTPEDVIENARIRWQCGFVGEDPRVPLEELIERRNKNYY
jgi:hypothetical protein